MTYPSSLRAPAVLTLAALLLGPAAGPPRRTAGQEAAARPNIVLILADDLGYGDLGVYGHPLIRTPRIDGLAREGVRLTSYYAGAPACTPARAALLTGRYPQRMGLGSVLMPESTAGFPPREVTMAEALATAGYRSAAIGKWHVGHASPSLLPTGQGFASWFGLPYSNDMIIPWVQTMVPLRLYRDAAPLDGEVRQEELTRRYTEEAVRIIREAAAPATPARAPFFLYLAHNMPHLPIRASDAFRGRSPAGLYGDVIEELDWSTGQILDALDSTGLARHTLVVFVSDNGPWLDLPARMLQAGNEPWHAGSAGLLRGSKGTTWEGGVRVPGIIRWPGTIPAASVSHGLTTAMDVFATLIAAGGASAALTNALDGRDLRAHLAGDGPSPTSEFVYVNGSQIEGIRQGAWKLRVTKDAAPQLFHLELDPSERYDRAAAEPAVVERLRQRLDAIRLTPD
jgi:arylsulfatase A